MLHARKFRRVRSSDAERNAMHSMMVPMVKTRQKIKKTDEEDWVFGKNCLPDLC